MALNLVYRVDRMPSVAQFIQLLHDSTLAERRPVENEGCMAGMLANSNLVVTAWQGEVLVGISRCMTDFHYACYLSDLAVHREYQRQGVGKQLLAFTLSRLENSCKMILVAAPAANNYYAAMGFENNPRCWVYTRGDCGRA
jgi:ribosomal protein S18 acetylase RimI-like enzyme